MKYLLLSLTTVAFLATSAIASANCACCSEPLTVFTSKAGESKVKLSTSTGTEVSVVPIKFADGATWANVKDSYNVPCPIASKVKAGKACITVDTDGKASFRAKK